jgi:hypothetical protein
MLSGALRVISVVSYTVTGLTTILRTDWEVAKSRHHLVRELTNIHLCRSGLLSDSGTQGGPQDSVECSLQKDSYINLLSRRPFTKYWREFADLRKLKLQTDKENYIMRNFIDVGRRMESSGI